MKICLRQIIWPIVVLLCILAVANVASASDNETGVLRYNIPVMTGVERYVEILESPTYLALAAQNNGIKIVGNNDIVIKDQQTFDIKGIEFKFIKKDGNLFYYQASLDISIMGGKAPPSLTMVVDVSEFHNKLVNVTVSSTFIKYLPENVMEIIRAKIQTIASPPNQEKILEYFNKLSKSSSQYGDVQGIFNAIVTDAHNIDTKSDNQVYGLDTTLRGIKSTSVILYFTMTLLIVMVGYFVIKRRRA